MIIEEIRSGPIVNMDETTVQVLAEPGRANTTKSFMWVARGGIPEKPVVLFRYYPTRAASVAAEILGDFKGYLQTDGYSGYEALGEREGLRHLGCLAHVRRKFVEVEKSAGKKAKGGTAHAVLDLIGKLYGVEHQAEKQKLDPGQIKALRAEKSSPILDKLKALLDARVATTPPQSLLGRAIGYALKQWDRLVVYLEDGRLRPDNQPGRKRHPSLCRGAQELAFLRPPTRSRRIGRDLLPHRDRQGQRPGAVPLPASPLRTLADGNFRRPAQGPHATVHRSKKPDYPCLNFCRLPIALTRCALLSAYGLTYFAIRFLRRPQHLCRTSS